MASSRLMVIEVGNLLDLAADSDRDPLVEVEFPQPVLSEPRLADEFRRLHAALERPTTRLEREERLAGWLAAMVDLGGARPAKVDPTPRDERALRRAMDYLGDHSNRNVGLDELAAAAGIGKFRLVRLFRDRTGLPPHSLQLAHRIRTARRRDRLRRPEPPASSLPAQPRPDSGPVPAPHPHHQPRPAHELKQSRAMAGGAVELVWQGRSGARRCRPRPPRASVARDVDNPGASPASSEFPPELAAV
jgi:AraC-like DNA-binding protein